MGRKPITINDPNPSIIDNQEERSEDRVEKNIIEFDDIDEKIEENKPITTENKEVEKILLIYSDKTYDVLLPH